MKGQRVSEPSEVTEETRLMLAVRDQRDKDAFARLFDLFAPRLKAMIMKGGTPAAQAEDIVQDAMLSVWRKAAQFDPHRAQASGWIYRIARNRMIDIARREARPVPQELQTEATAPEEDPGQILGLSQETDLLRQALAALPQKQREMIERAYLGELTHQEITEETGLPLGTIKSRIRLGLERLRHELKDLRPTP
ncbi:sigma-70 family RNA polymerase sigma factor [Shimia biformata]|uniref:sigma-70 family RNA polymerase sigma factor n=1 Tax=Shimia biformata TaxID=1294299 RepID=UPI001EF1E492|nr:sigma-70 family RNA polymerase sigma factor [Shimia biformata]